MECAATGSHKRRKPQLTIALTKQNIALVRSLQRKKERDGLGLFVAEGSKTITELLPYFHCKALWCTAGANLATADVERQIISQAELERLSLLQTPQDAVAVFEKRTAEPVSFDDIIIALDGVQDPGNVGTIIRLADWYGIRHIVCSADTADCYNPKTVQATMGSLARVNIVYTSDLALWLGSIKDIPKYGTLLDGDDIYSVPLATPAIVVMGSEGHGISDSVRKHLTARLRINPYPANARTAESLNVAIATAITIAEFRRRKI